MYSVTFHKIMITNRSENLSSHRTDAKLQFICNNIRGFQIKPFWHGVCYDAVLFISQFFLQKSD